MKFGIIADPQYADTPPSKSLNRDYRASLKKIHTALNYFNTQNLSFIVILGDLVDNGLNNFPPILKSLKSSKHKIHLVAGNHDYYAINGDRKALAKLFSTPNTYYSWSEAGYRFIILDTNDGIISQKGFTHQKEHALEAPTKKSLPGINYWLTDRHAWNGYIQNPQKSWLKKELKSAHQSKEKVIIFGHDPIYPTIHDRLRNADEILRLLHKESPNTPIAYLAGHYHDGAYAEIMSTAFITFKAMVSATGTAYSTVELIGPNIKTQGFGIENSYTFTRKKQ